MRVAPTATPYGAATSTLHFGLPLEQASRPTSRFYLTGDNRSIIRGPSNTRLCRAPLLFGAIEQ